MIIKSTSVPDSRRDGVDPDVTVDAVDTEVLQHYQKSKIVVTLD